MKKKYLLSLVFLAHIIGCGGNDDSVTDDDPSNDNSSEEITPPPINNPPSSFSLLTVQDGATEVNFKPTFSWNSAIDPENGTITYDLLLDTSNNPSTVVASEIQETTFTIQNNLTFDEVYYWKVIARDDAENFSESDIFSFTTKDLFSLVTANAEFTQRLGLTSVSFDNRLWVLNGVASSGSSNDVWSSEDGATWQRINGSPDYGGRTEHSTSVFKDSLWVIGGYTANANNDVWSSGDGITWVQKNAMADFSPRLLHTSIVFQDKLWVIGGSDQPLDVMGDVWNSEDGVNWSEITTQAPKKARHTATVFDDKIWLVAGLGENGRRLEDRRIRPVVHGNPADGSPWDSWPSRPPAGSLPSG